jgi:DNA topoisomerase-1
MARRDASAPADAEASADQAGLVYVSDQSPGIRRLGRAPRFRYVDASGKPLRSREARQRIRALAVPPVWTDVWICPHACGHIQASGRDARGRKQYRYHRRWRAVRDETKFDRMIAFGQALPRMRRRVAHDLGLPGLPQDKVLATVVRILESTGIRVGNEEYARQNQHFGLTTLRNHHVDCSGPRPRQAPRRRAGRQARGPRRVSLSEPAGTGALPVSRRRGRTASGRFRGRERLSARHRR